MKCKRRWSWPSVILLLGLITYNSNWCASPSATKDSLSESHWPYHTEDDPASKDAKKVDLLEGHNFLFVWGDGSGLFGYDVVKVLGDGDGSVTYTFQNPRGNWNEATFNIGGKTLTQLRQLLAAVNYWQLKKAYSANVADGTQRFVKVQAGGTRKAVWCDNFFPPEVMRIKKFVESSIIAPNGVAIGQAKPVTITIQNMEHETFE